MELVLLNEAVVHHPVPYFIMDKQLTIKDASNEASERFPISTSSFLDLVDSESQQKVIHLLTKRESAVFEANMKTKENPLSLFDLYPKWVNDSCHLICIEKAENIHHIMQLIHRLREQLDQTNFDEYTSNMKRDIIPSILNINMNDMNRLSITNASGRVEEIPNKVESIQELISIFRPDLIEVGKSDYLEIIDRHLDEILAISHYLIAITPIFNKNKEESE